MILEDLLNQNGLFGNRCRLIKRLSDEGAAADVWLAIDTLTLEKKINDDGDTEAVADEDSGARVAIKIYRPKNALDVEGESLFVKEFKTAYYCQHDNLLTPTGYGIANDVPLLIGHYRIKNGRSLTLDWTITAFNQLQVSYIINKTQTIMQEDKDTLIPNFLMKSLCKKERVLR